MLRFLRHKLKSQSLNEPRPVYDQSDEDRDSGTESDDENPEFEAASTTTMEADEVEKEEKVHNFRPRTRQSVCLENKKVCKKKKNPERPKCRPKATCPSPTVGQVDSALPSDSDHNYDHHSSEEELEVINNGSNENEPPKGSGHQRASSAMALMRRCAAAYAAVDRDRCGAEKRKWSQANRLSFGDSSASSDDELRDLLGSAPVEFCASPPADAHKPGGGSFRCQHQQQQMKSTPPPAKLFHFSSSNFTPFEVCTTVSPRKRHRHAAAPGTAAQGHNARAHMQRPCLDFEKMRQLRDRAVSGWRQSRELSLIC